MSRDDSICREEAILCDFVRLATRGDATSRRKHQIRSSCEPIPDKTVYGRYSSSRTFEHWKQIRYKEWDMPIQIPSNMTCSTSDLDSDLTKYFVADDHVNILAPSLKNLSPHQFLLHIIHCSTPYSSKCQTLEPLNFIRWTNRRCSVSFFASPMSFRAPLWCLKGIDRIAQSHIRSFSPWVFNIGPSLDNAVRSA